MVENSGVEGGGVSEEGADSWGGGWGEREYRKKGRKEEKKKRKKEKKKEKKEKKTIFTQSLSMSKENSHSSRLGFGR